MRRLTQAQLFIGAAILCVGSLLIWNLRRDVPAPAGRSEVKPVQPTGTGEPNRRQGSPPSPEFPPLSKEAAQEPASSTTPPPTAGTPHFTASPAALPFSGEITADLDELRTTLRDFRAALGENPVGTNAEITSALLGQNSKQLKLGIPPGSALSGTGELTDRWGTPYFFHQLSRTEMEIRSAGPDRSMWTPDDRLAK